MNTDPIDRWVEGYSAPDKPLFSDGGRTFTPRIIAEEFRTESDLGRGLFFGIAKYIQEGTEDGIRKTMIPDSRGNA